MKTAILLLLCVATLVSCKKKEDTFNWSCKGYTTVSWSNKPIDSLEYGLSSATEEQARESEMANTHKESVWNKETGEHEFAEVVTKCVKQ